MKIKEGFVLRQVADTWAVLPMAQATLDFNGILTLNESGVLLWNALKQCADREALADALLSEYNVDRDQALTDVDEFLAKLNQAGCLE